MGVELIPPIFGDRTIHICLEVPSFLSLEDNKRRGIKTTTTELLLVMLSLSFTAFRMI